MNRRCLFIVCLLLILHVQKSSAQEKLTCLVTNASYKIRQTNGEWSGWRPYNTDSEQKKVNIIFDFSKMNMFWVAQANGNAVNPGISIYRITNLEHDTTYKQFGFYNIKLKCLDAKDVESSYELISMITGKCHTLMLVSTDDKFITRRELEILK